MHAGRFSSLLGRRRSLKVAALAALAALLPLDPGAFGHTFLPTIMTSSTVPANGDVNPYGVALVPFGFPSGAAISAGDVLISNFNNNANLQGTGSTIIVFTAAGDIAPNGSAQTFFQGPSGVGLTTALEVLVKGLVLVGNVPTADGTFQTIRSGSILVIDRNGNLVQTIPATAANKLDGPWDFAVFDEGNHAILFVSNVLGGTVARLDLQVNSSSVTIQSATQIAAGYGHAPNAAALVVGPTGLAFNPTDDVLFVASTADNAIFAIPNAAASSGSSSRGVLITEGGRLRGPLGMKFSPEGHLLVANGDSINVSASKPSEILEFTENGEFVTSFNVDAEQGGAFGLAQGPAAGDDTSLVVVDDVTNTLQLYPLSP
jgi:DNA-binding beta-propeller fold protein YncE